MGIIHWLFQRISNLVVVIFGLWLLITLANGIDASTLSELLSSGFNHIFILIVLVLASLNSILAGWQIAGDYARKFGINQNLMVGIGAVISLGYLLTGLNILY